MLLLLLLLQSTLLLLAVMQDCQASRCMMLLKQVHSTLKFEVCAAMMPAKHITAAATADTQMLAAPQHCAKSSDSAAAAAAVCLQ
jgi:hypothetical protein